MLLIGSLILHKFKYEKLKVAMTKVVESCLIYKTLLKKHELGLPFPTLGNLYKLR